MAEEGMAPAPAGEEGSPDLHPDLGTLESRLSPAEIAQLDQMNAFAFGEAPPPPDGNEPPAAPPPATKPAEQPAPAPTDDLKLPPGILPPEDVEIPPGEPGGEPPAAPEELPAGAEVVTDADIEKFRTEKAKKDVSALRQFYDKSREELKAAREKLAEMEKAGGAPNADLEAKLKDALARNAELNAIVERKAIGDHPWVKATFTEPRDQALAQAQKALELAQVGGESLKKILALPEAERISALDDLYESIQSPTLKGKVQSAVARIDQIDDQFAAFMADREANSAKLEELEKVRSYERTAEQTKNFENMIERTFDYLGNEKKNPFFRKSDKPGQEEWNKALEADIAAAKELLLRNEDPNRLLAAGVVAARAERIYTAYVAAMRMVKERDAKIASLTGARPNILNGDRIAPSVQREEAPKPGESLMDAGMRALREVSSGG
jgi:hypothetical protein